MKRVLLFIVLLAGGLCASAWLGISDSGSGAGRSPSQLNSLRRQPALNDGEILVWSPDMPGPPPGGVAMAQPRAVIRTPAPQTRTVAASQARAFSEPRSYNSGARDYSHNRFYSAASRLEPLARPLGAPRSGEWRSRVREQEQDFGSFMDEVRIVSGTVIVQPVGDLPADQKRALGHFLDAVSAFFGVPAVCAPPLPLSSLPPQCFRNGGNARALNPRAVVSTVLRPQVGGNVAAIIAVTALDLRPDGDWPFEKAFGWSSFASGAAVVSTADALDRNPAYIGRNLLRICKIGIHELAHDFGMRHCTGNRCLMNGAGGIREIDAQPLSLCPECLAKLSLATGRDPALHIEDMLGLCQAKGFGVDAKYYQNAIGIMSR